MSEKRTFREFLIDNEDTLLPDDAAECWVAWYLDVSMIGGVETWDVNDGPVEHEWPGARP